MSKENYNKEKEHIIQIAKDNGFQKKMIHKKINKFKEQKVINESTLQTDKNIGKKFKKFTYHPLVFDKFQKIFNKFNIKLAPKNDYSLGNLIKTNKNEKIEDCKKSGIYQINCKDCEKIYIGKTKRNLNTRLKEHLRNVKNGETEKSAIAAHAWSEKHRIETKAKLLKQLEKPKELTIWEKIYICKNENTTMNFEIPSYKERGLIWKFFGRPPDGAEVSLQDRRPLDVSCERDAALRMSQKM
ncbi:hypothetical protein L9F63_004974 [Diploptera punctata]|uniref:GIY-YIG domain-containing protein n=1 Tax=Diploptera punctata TaxID=6984 RepID=A0AAD7ZE07_DIPPU|nr:hypothetical protein L9F63_004974 [Diploptera punctata]